MPGALEWVLVAEGVLLLAVAAFLALRAGRDLAAWLVVFLLVGLVAGGIARDFILLVGASPLYVRLTGLPGRAFLVGTLLVLAFTFPRTVPRPLRARHVLLVLAPPALVLLLFALVPETLERSREGATLVGWFFAAAAVANAVVGIVLVRRWLHAPPGPHRDQVAIVLAAVTVWLVNDGVGVLARALEPEMMQGPPFARPFHLGGAAVGLLVPFAVSAAVLGSWSGRSLAERAIVGCVAVMVPLSTLQFALAPQLHLVVDALAYPVLAYGVAKYRILDVDLTLKRGLKGSVVGAVGLVVLLGVEQVVEFAVGSTFGLVAGVAAAALVVITLQPLHRLAERVSERALPDVRQDASYLAYRRLQVYRVALEGMLATGRAPPEDAVRALQRELNVTPEEHALLLDDIQRAGARPA